MYNLAPFLLSLILGLLLLLAFLASYYNPVLVYGFSEVSFESLRGGQLSSCLVSIAGFNPYTGIMDKTSFNMLLEKYGNASNAASTCFKSYLLQYVGSFTINYYPLVVLTSSFSLYFLVRRLGHREYLQLLVSKPRGYYSAIMLLALSIVFSSYSPALAYVYIPLASVFGWQAYLAVVFLLAGLLVSLMWGLAIYLASSDESLLIVVGFIQFFWVVTSSKTYELFFNPGLRLAGEVLSTGSPSVASLAVLLVYFAALFSMILYFSRRIVEVY